jgi:hypothetical protein
MAQGQLNQRGSERFVTRLRLAELVVWGKRRFKLIKRNCDGAAHIAIRQLHHIPVPLIIQTAPDFSYLN